MARMPDMSVVAKFPGARLAFLASREVIFCLCCLHVWSLALWSAASGEPQAQLLLLRCTLSHVLSASGDHTAFFIIWLWLLQNWVSQAESLLFLCHPLAGLAGGYPHSFVRNGNEGDQDYHWLELGSLYSLGLPPGHVSSIGEMYGYWCNMFHQDHPLIFFVWRPTTAISLAKDQPSKGACHPGHSERWTSNIWECVCMYQGTGTVPIDHYTQCLNTLLQNGSRLGPYHTALLKLEMRKKGHALGG